MYLTRLVPPFVSLTPRCGEGPGSEGTAFTRRSSLERRRPACAARGAPCGPGMTMGGTWGAGPLAGAPPNSAPGQRSRAGTGRMHPVAGLPSQSDALPRARIREG